MKYTISSRRQSSGNEIKFLDRLYWVVGSFCLAWAFNATVTILRRITWDIPGIGKAQISETIIFTLTAFSVLLPLLLFIVAKYRGMAAMRRLSSRFPGVSSDKWEIPHSFNWLRWGIFAAVVVFPVATMQFCYQRMAGKLEIVRYPNFSDRPLQGDAIFKPQPSSEPDGKRIDWRWHGEDISTSGTPAFISALPGYQPWAYRLISYGTIVVTLWFLAAPAGVLRRGLATAIRKIHQADECP